MSAPTPRATPAHTFALLAVTVAVFVLPLGSGLPLLDPDEGLHAAIAREMVERGDWVTPRLLQAPFLDKPVLFFWAQAGSISLLGPSELAVRLPGLLLGLAGALAVGLLARVTCGPGRGAMASAFCATTLLPLALAQAAVHDVVLVPCVALALAAFWKAAYATGSRKRLWWCVCAGLPLGVSVLAKGLAGVAIAGLAFSVWLLAARRVRPSLLVGGVIALAVAAAVAAPWYLAMERANPGYFRYYFAGRHLLGFATTTQIHGERAWWYYFPIVLLGSLPWVLYLPSAWRHRRDSSAQGREAGRLAWIWLIGGTAFLSAAGSKMVTYVWPVFPAVALLASQAWGAATPPRWARWLHTVFGLALLPATALVAGLRFGTRVDAAQWTMFALVAVAWLAAGPHRLAPLPRAAWQAAALTAVSFLVALFVVMPPIASGLSARELARHLNAQDTAAARLWVFDERIGSLLFYLDERRRAGLTPDRVENVGPDRLLSTRQPPAGTLVAVPIDRLGRLSARVDLSRAPHIVVGHYALFSGEAVYEAATAAVEGRR